MSDPSRVYVVPSAPGKRFSGDEKVTDLLYRMYYKASKDEDFGEELDEIKARYQEIIDGLGLEGFSLEGEFAQIERKMHHEPRSNYAASRGEYLNGRIMARYLGYKFIDAKGNIVDEATYRAQCEAPEPVIVPDTADLSGLLLMLVGTMLIGGTMVVLNTIKNNA